MFNNNQTFMDILGDELKKRNTNTKTRNILQ